MGSNIDVTVVSRGVVRQVSSWKVRDELFISDHRMIVFVLKGGETCRRNFNVMRRGTFAVRNANWLMFDWLIVKGMDSLNELNVSLEEEVRVMERTIKDACYGSIPVATAGAKKVSWWAKDIEILRKSKGKLEKSWKRCRRMYVWVRG